MSDLLKRMTCLPNCRYMIISDQLIRYVIHTLMALALLQLDKNGKVLQSLHDPTGNHAYSISAAHQHNGELYLGSLAAPYILKLKL